MGSQALLGGYLIKAYEVSENLLNQLIVVLSAISKVALIYALIKVLLWPFGANIAGLATASSMLNTLLAGNTFALTTGGIISAVLILY